MLSRLSSSLAIAIATGQHDVHGLGLFTGLEEMVATGKYALAASGGARGDLVGRCVTKKVSAEEDVFVSHYEETVLPSTPMSDVRARTRVDVSTGSVWTVVVAGGSGRRFGSMKQYEALGDRRVLDHAVDTARAGGDGVVLVLPQSDVADEVTWGATSDVIVVAGGPTRTASVRNGLKAVPSDAAIVLVHDGARPFASAELYRLVIAAVRGGADGAVPGLPVTDTVKVIEVVESASIGVGGSVVPHIVDTPDRATLLAVQTPQGFVAEILRRAYLSEVDASDDSALVESIGGTVIAVPGEIDNRKITHPEDLVWARDVLARRDGSVTS